MPVLDEPTASVATVTSAPRRAVLAVPRTRAGAVWTWLGTGALVLALLVVFLLQNTAPVAVTFLGTHGSAPLSLMLAIAGVAVGVGALTVGLLRRGRLGHLRTGALGWVAAPASRGSL